MSDVSASVARPVRTAAQATVAGGIVEFIDAFNIYSMDGRQYAAAVVALLILFSWLQVLLENWLDKGFLRTPNE